MSGTSRNHFETRILFHVFRQNFSRHQNLVSFGENAVRAIFFDRRISSVKIWRSTKLSGDPPEGNICKSSVHIE
jgi:hypothetical protein